MLELTDIERKQLSSMHKEVIQASQEEILMKKLKNDST